MHGQSMTRAPTCLVCPYIVVAACDWRHLRCGVCLLCTTHICDICLCFRFPSIDSSCFTRQEYCYRSWLRCCVSCTHSTMASDTCDDYPPSGDSGQSFALYGGVSNLIFDQYHGAHRVRLSGRGMTHRSLGSASHICCYGDRQITQVTVRFAAHHIWLQAEGEVS